MTDEATISGGCHCGAVQYTVGGGLQFQFLCHCDNCRSLNGGMRLAGAGAQRSALEVQGEPTRYTYRGGKDDIELQFCGRCGTPLFALPKLYPESVVLRSNSLKDQGRYAPRKSLHGEQACAWETLLGE